MTKQFKELCPTRDREVIATFKVTHEANQELVMGQLVNPVMLACMMQGLAYSHIQGDRLEAMCQADCSGQPATHFMAILCGCMMPEGPKANYSRFLQPAFLLPSK